MRILSIILVLCFGHFSQKSIEQPPPEICNNGIDDDGDGLIDLNDTLDCKCEGINDTLFAPSSLIPNPSFEDTLCCPAGLAQLNCSANWIQASSATSDFFHTCGFDRDAQRGAPPLPLPAGDAYVGFLDIAGFFGVIYKEYVGACLTETMQASENYTLEFYLGFGRAGQIYSANSPVTIVLYGTSDCTQLPFGGPRFQNCPSVLPQWFEIDRVTLRGSNEWVLANMSFSPTQDVEAVAIGTSCTPSSGNHYYFLDDLVLNETSRFGSLSFDIDGENCDTLIRLHTRPINYPGVTYQWFKDGIAIVGEVSEEYFIRNQEGGKYILMVSLGGDCELSTEFDYVPLTSSMSFDTTLCAGESIMVNGQMIDATLIDTIIINNVAGCDSTILIDVLVLDTTVVTIDTMICEDQIITVASQTFDEEGEHRLVIENAQGCDSIIYLNVEVTDTLFYAFDTTICLFDSLVYNNKVYKASELIEESFLSVNGCDSLVSINLTVHDTSLTRIDTILCQGQPLNVGGAIITANGNYPFVFNTTEGCDSTLIYQVVLADTFRIFVDTHFCTGEILVINGQNIDQAGDVPFQFSTTNGCDSTMVYRVREEQMFQQDFMRLLCFGDTLAIYDSLVTETGSYTFTWSNQWGCDSIENYNVMVLDTTMTFADSALCFRDSLVWGSQTIKESGTFTFTDQGVNGCDSTIVITVTINPEVNVDSVRLLDVTCYETQDGMVDVFVDNANWDILWNDGNSNFERDNLPPGIYTYTITDDLGCSFSKEVEITQPDPIELMVSHADIGCDEGAVGQINILSITGGSGVYAATLNGEAIDLNKTTIDGLTSGNFTLTVKDINGCTKDTIVRIGEVVPGDISLNTVPEEVILGDSIELMLSFSNIDSIVSIDWTGPGGVCPECINWTVTPTLGENIITVLVIDSNGCIYELSVLVTAVQKFYVPNTFTPNGDGLNDLFNVFTDRSIQQVNFLRIYDRWGEMVYAENNILPGGESGWDGSLNGEKLNPGVFVYQMELLDKLGKTFLLSGDVTLMY